MTTTPAQVDLWRSVPKETQQLEFKEAKTQLDGHSLYEYCVALANEGGGHLVLGVADNLPRAVVGTQAFRDPVAVAKQIFDAVGFRVDVDVVAHPDGRVLVFRIPSRLRGTAYHLHGRYLMRSGNGLVGMSEDQLRRIFAEGAPDPLEEHVPGSCDAQEVVERLDVQAMFELRGLPYPATREGVIDRLVADGLVDATAGAFRIRRIAALLLARRLEEFGDLGRKAPRLVVYAGRDKLRTRLDRTWSRGYAVGFREIVRDVMAHLPQNEVIEDALRREVKLVPEEVVRELVANALIHQDLAVGGASVMIEVYLDRVEISNPGDPVVPVERFIDGYQSRNERVADLMRRMGICEEKSSGIDRVIVAAEAYQLPAPDFRAAHRRTSVTLFGPRPFEDMDRSDRVRACYQHCALRWVMSQRMTNQSLRARFHLTQGKIASVSQVIAATVESGLIKPDAKVGASRKFARYLPFWA